MFSPFSTRLPYIFCLCSNLLVCASPAGHLNVRYNHPATVSLHDRDLLEVIGTLEIISTIVESDASAPTSFPGESLAPQSSTEFSDSVTGFSSVNQVTTQPPPDLPTTDPDELTSLYPLPPGWPVSPSMDPNSFSVSASEYLYSFSDDLAQLTITDYFTTTETTTLTTTLISSIDAVVSFGNDLVSESSLRSMTSGPRPTIIATVTEIQTVIVTTSL